MFYRNFELAWRESSSESLAVLFASRQERLETLCRSSRSIGTSQPQFQRLRVIRKFEDEWCGLETSHLARNCSNRPRESRIERWKLEFTNERARARLQSL